MIYFAFIHPHILYGIEVYGNTYETYLNKLVILNNKLLRILQNKPRKTHTADLYKSYNTLPIPLLFNFQVLTLIHKTYHHSSKLPDTFSDYFIMNSTVHTHHTRSSRDLHLKTVTTTSGTKALKFKGVNLWNRLPNHLKSIESTTGFKNKLKKHLFDQLY